MQRRRLVVRTGPGLSQEGDAVARTEEYGVVFVRGAATEELAEVELTKVKKSFARAKLLHVLEPSAERVTPQCAHYEACGGCALQHLSSSAQTEAKWAHVQSLLGKIGGQDLGSVQLEPPWAGAPYGYRTRARFGLSRAGEVGYRKRARHALVDVTTCPILSPPVQEALAWLRRAASKLVFPKGPRRTAARFRRGSGVGIYEVSVAAVGDQALLRLPQAFESASHLPTLPFNLTRSFHRGDGAQSLADQNRFGRERVSPSVFGQSNAIGNRALLETLDTWLAAGLDSSFLELYSGSGNLTRVLIQKASAVTSVESNTDACALAKQVLPPSSVSTMNCSSEDALQVFRERGQKFSHVVVNPPREGLSQTVAHGVCELALESIVYLSCGPSTFARDVHRFGEQGWVLKRLRFFDLYPQTAHTEVLGLFQRVVSL